MYKVRWEDEALRSLSRLDETTEKDLKSKVDKHLATDPFWNGKPMWGRWKGFWRLYLDDYRAIYEIVCEVREKEKEVIVAVVVKIGGRQDIYTGELPASSDYRITERPKVRDLSRKVVGNRGKRKVGC